MPLTRHFCGIKRTHDQSSYLSPLGYSSITPICRKLSHEPYRRPLVLQKFGVVFSPGKNKNKKDIMIHFCQGRQKPIKSSIGLFEIS
mmetsp:Transcript_13088/g.27796  ORF Transcript_13088/g.27796 Transcript_13088/m.27796 type:complete len:87 (+) Transcript_13088:339-599(+)